MRRYDKEMNKHEIKSAWYEVIAARGYFDYWLDYDEVEQLICYCYPTISRSFIRFVVWKKNNKEKEILKKYKYK